MNFLNFRLVLFPWTIGTRDLIQERQLAEIIEWKYKYVYLFDAFMRVGGQDFRVKLKNRAETGKCPIFQDFEVKFPQFVPEW